MAKKNRARKNRQQTPDTTIGSTAPVAETEPRRVPTAPAREPKSKLTATAAASEATQHDAARDTLWLRVLWFCIGLGAVCRFAGLNWDNAQHLHPDERFLTMIVPEMRLPQSVAMYFDTSRSLLNPQNLPNVGLFVYGQLPLSVVKAVASLLGRDNYDDVLGVGRAMSALFDCISILLLWRIGLRLGNRILGLFAAALLALVPLHIQHSHFFVVDTFATTFLLAAFLWCLRGIETPHKKRLVGTLPWLVAGLFWGAALASKISSLFFAVPLALLLFCATRQPQSAAEDITTGSTLSRHTVSRAAINGIALLLAAFLVFRIAHPMAFAGEARPATLSGLLDVRPAPPRPENKSFWQSVKEQKKITDGEVDVPFNVQWIGRRNFVYPLWNWLGWGTGWALGLAGLAGTAWVLWQGLNSRQRTDNVLPPSLIIGAVWIVFCVVYFGGQFSKFTRYYLPATPFLCLCAAWLLHHLSSRATTSTQTTVSRTLPALCLGLTALWGLAVTSIYARPHPRVAATQWITQNVPPGTVVATETAWDDALPLGGPQGLESLDLKLYDVDTEEKRQHLLDALDRAQWIFVSSQRAWQSVPRVPQRWPLTTEYYRALFDGYLGFKPVQQWANYPQLFGIAVPDEHFEEALSVYDHPRVVLFRKTPEWSRVQAEKILNAGLVAKASNTTLRQVYDLGWRPEAQGPLPQLPSPRR
jgi:4-amino-4-deoxy-L-arabinose transferase-like glycosyltransferase